MAEALLFEHEDGRHAVNPDTTGDPKWHRVGPVDVSALSTNAGEAAEPVAYLLTRPSGFAWAAMAREVTPVARAVHEGDGVRIEPLYATPPAAIPAAPMTDERAAFEDWAHKLGHDIHRSSGTGYLRHTVQLMWMAWQARAALAQPAPLPPLED